MRSTLKIFIFICTLAFGMAYKLSAQDSYAEKANRYVSQYKELAMAEQRRSGIPASITLGQGILETEAGCSELATGANNHFGIKCKSGWKGETFAHTDDAPNECFRKYKCCEDSYKDHSDYLKNTPRYAALFKLPVGNYAAWATGLKKCGYATSPVYAKKLIGIIETFNLQQFTLAAMTEPGPEMLVTKADNPAQSIIPPTPVQEQEPTTIVTRPAETKPAFAQADKPNKQLQNDELEVNGLRAIKGHKGDVLLQYAMKFHIRYEKLLEMNDLPDAPLSTDMYIYLEKKNTQGAHHKHTVMAGETMQIVAQGEGIQLKKLMALNHISDGEEPVPGDILFLQTEVSIKPYVVRKQVKSSPKEKLAKTNAEAGRQSGSEQMIIRKHSASANPEAKKDTQVVQAIPESSVATPEINNSVAAPGFASSIADGTPVTQTSAVEKTVTPPPADLSKKENHVIVALDTNKPVSPLPPPPIANDPLSRLKARLDKMVYSKDSVDAPVAQATAEVIPPDKKETAPAEKNIAGAKYYTVRPGDTGFSIAKKNNITVSQLRQLNNLDFDQINIGQKLRIK